MSEFSTLARLRALSDAQVEETPEPPVARDPVASDQAYQTEATGFVSAKVPLKVKYRYDDHVRRLKISSVQLRNLDKTRAMVALIALLDDPEIHARWAELARNAGP